MTETISVLLPVHDGVEADHLARALDSLAQQTLQPDEVVIVQDGPLRRELLDTLDRFASSRPGVIRVPLETNVGAGVANQSGLLAASGVWIAKADADDINDPERFQRQLAYVLDNDVDVCGTAMAEFDRDELIIRAIRRNPTVHSDIARRMKWNNPINHPTAMYRRDIALAVGGYPAMRYMQDYDLFARMLIAGARFANMDVPLVRFRADPAMLNRRRSVDMNRYERELQKHLHEYGLISLVRSRFNVLGRTAIRRLPPAILHRLYDRTLRTPVAGE